jgi:hypothetical protein
MCGTTEIHFHGCEKGKRKNIKRLCVIFYLLTMFLVDVLVSLWPCCRCIVLEILNKPSLVRCCTKVHSIFSPYHFFLVNHIYLDNTNLYVQSTEISFMEVCIWILEWAQLGNDLLKYTPSDLKKVSVYYLREANIFGANSYYKIHPI